MNKNNSKNLIIIVLAIFFLFLIFAMFGVFSYQGNILITTKNTPEVEEFHNNENLDQLQFNHLNNMGLETPTDPIHVQQQTLHDVLLEPYEFCDLKKKSL